MATVDEFVNTMKTQLGKPYVWGANSPSVGFDCSGIIYWALDQLGIDYPRTSADIIAKASSISVSTALKTKGALLYFPGHIVISLGNGQILEAPAPGGVVRITADYGGWTRAGIITQLKDKEEPTPEVKEVIFEDVSHMTSTATLAAGVRTFLKAASGSTPVNLATMGDPGLHTGFVRIKADGLTPGAKIDVVSTRYDPTAKTDAISHPFSLIADKTGKIDGTAPFIRYVRSGTLLRIGVTASEKCTLRGWGATTVRYLS